jgi:putative oligomerization/nucleic acid binding protein/PH (Pleckstrin Homology) domain-containing protein
VSTAGATSASAQRDQTAKYASLLATDERVLLVKQRHWLTFLEAGRWFVLALGAGIVLAALNRGVPNNGVAGPLSTLLSWAFWLFLLIGLIGVGWYFLVWRVERYLVTTRRVIEAGGVINKYTRDTSLQAITDMIVGHPWLGRIVGYGEIDLLTASEAGTTKIRFLPDADGFKKTLLDAKHEHELEVGGARIVQAPAVSPAPAGMSADELDSALSRLADLRDRGLITKEEFDAKKRDLLERF